jgi:soluble lytic murein transglycosylase-like protein
MKQSFTCVMLVCIITATRVSADPLNAGLGVDRSSLSPEQIAARSERLETSTSFSLLRFPEALRAPARIFEPSMWRAIESAARTYDLEPMMLAGMIFIESYGDPMAKSPTGPAGIAQLTKGSARELGLSTGRKIRIGTKSVKRTRWVGTGKNRRKVVQTVQQPVYKTLDERYVPERAIMAMARRLSHRRSWLGGNIDFAVAEYHMGAGRMAGLLSAYFGRTIHVSDVPAEMRDADVSYAELFWTNTPYFRPAVYEALGELNRVDYSPTYYFRVRQAMRLLEMYRQSPASYAQLASIYQGRFGWSVLPSSQWSFVSDPIGGAVLAASRPGVLHQDAAERFVLLPDVASVFGVRAATSAMSAERSTIGSALFVAHQLKRLQGDRYSGFQITRMLESSFAGCADIATAASQKDCEEDGSEPLHSLGWAFDVPSTGLSKSEQRDLKFILTDLRQAGLITYVEDSTHPAFHVVRHPEHAAQFEQFYWDAMAGLIPADLPRQASVVQSGTTDGSRSFGEVRFGGRARGVIMALNSLMSQVYSFFAG